MENVYKLLVVGGGISSCTLVSNCIKKGFEGKIAIVENGRNLGGRFSSRISLKNKGTIINHGSPIFNIINPNEDKLLIQFINQLIDNDLIIKNDSLIYEVDENLNIYKKNNNIFYSGKVYKTVNSMSNLSEEIINLNNINNQIDFHFKSMIKELKYSNNNWQLKTTDNRIFKAEFLVLSSNLLLHKRSKDILKINHIPLRKAIQINKCNIIDEIIELTNCQSFSKRINFLIYTNSDYKLKDINEKRNIHFLFSQKCEKDLGFERIIFQQQYNDKISIVIHTRNYKLLNTFQEDKIILPKAVLNKFNIIFKNNMLINQIYDFHDFSIMKWRASQPEGDPIPVRLQLSEKFKIGFCGDWFQFHGFGRVEGAILSGLYLAEKIMSS